MLTPSYLYGLHDEEAAPLIPPGGWCLGLVSLSENYQGKNYAAIRKDINWILRINWGYGSTGTIPPRDKWPDFFYRLSAFLSATQGVSRIIIGNEPNHEQERPNGKVIEPEEYAEFFTQCWHVASVLSNTPWQVAPAPLAPYHAEPIPWNVYAIRMYNSILERGVTPGFIPVHTYLRGARPEDVWDKTQMGPPLTGLFYGFLSYLDAIQCIPSPWMHLPVHITECNEILPDGWLDQNTGVVKAAYGQIDWHNEQVEDRNPIQSLILYRYPRYDKWHIEGKNQVLHDFQDAVTLALRSPVEATRSDLMQTFVPSIQNNPNSPSSPSTSFESDVDSRIENMVKIETSPNDKWVVKQVKWFDRDQAGGRHHVYVETVDENGNAIPGQKFIFGWPSGAAGFVTNNRYGFDAANQQFSPGQGAFYVKLENGPKVSGLGMGQWTPEGFNPGEHTATLVTFQKKANGGVAPPPTPPVQPDIPVQPSEPENLSLPFDGDYPITQVFGVNEQYYKQFKVDGVPLRGHNGIDYGTPIGTPIEAVDGGQVIEVGDDPGGYGKYIKIRHLWGESLYAHLSTITKGYGDVIQRGEVLGRSGNTGNSTGPHLHLGMRVFPYNRKDGWGGYINPAEYLPLNAEPVEEEQVPITANPIILSAIHQASIQSKQDYNLLASLAWAESSFRPWLQDGLFQIGDATWKDWAGRVGATERSNPLDNAKVGAAYFRFLLNRYQGNYYKALYAWNWGPGNVDTGKEPPAITKEFANKVLHGRDLLNAMGV